MGPRDLRRSARLARTAAIIAYCCAVIGAAAGRPAHVGQLLALAAAASAYAVGVFAASPSARHARPAPRRMSGAIVMPDGATVTGSGLAWTGPSPEPAQAGGVQKKY